MPSVLEQIVTWSKTRPSWQRDALRRLALEEDAHHDTNYFTTCCLASHGLADDPGMEPLSADHIATVPGGTPPVRITAVGALKNVNALQDDQTLEVATDGLTLIYGGNGTGKSGFMRVFKQVCRARGGAPPVYPNVYTKSPGPPSARISFTVGAHAHECDWTAGVPAPAELSAVSTFDAHSASVYVSQNNELAYVPSGLHLLQRLTTLCDRVQQRVDQKKAVLDASRCKLPDVSPLSRLAALLDALGTNGAVEAVGDYVALSDEDAKRLNELRALRARLDAEDPRKRAREMRQRASRIMAASDRFAAAATALSDDKVTAYREADDAYHAAERAARIASSTAFTNEPVDGIGTDEWNALWSAARAFSEQHAYPGRDFPVTEEAACVLCQQPIGSAASSRLTRFEAFVRDTTRAQADQARARSEALRAHIVRVQTAPIVDEELSVELVDVNSQAANTLDAAIATLLRRREAATTRFGAEWAPLPPVPSFPTTLVNQARDLVASAAELLEAVDPERRKRVDTEFTLLNDRATIAGALADIQTEHDRRLHLRKLEACRSDTHTNAISNFARVLTESAATATMIAQFDYELKALGLTSVGARIESKGAKKGKPYAQLALPIADDATASVDEVLSEGERRCAALAALLAEISLQESSSTLVLDDPCSSLDHRRREQMARRIVALARERPVVVFTHDLVFLLDVQDEAERQKVTVAERRLATHSGRGVVKEGFPFKGAKPSKRIGTLKQELVRLKKLHDDDPDAYDSQAAQWYGRLRETWERAVEEVMLNGAVKRFGREVSTGRLKNIVGLEQRHIDALDAGMTKSSRWLPGHDEPAADSADTPAPDELEADLAALAAWVKDLNKVHN